MMQHIGLKSLIVLPATRLPEAMEGADVRSDESFLCAYNI